MDPEAPVALAAVASVLLAYAAPSRGPPCGVLPAPEPVARWTAAARRLIVRGIAPQGVLAAVGEPMTRSTIVTPLLAVALVAAGCGSSSSGGTNTSTPSAYVTAADTIQSTLAQTCFGYPPGFFAANFNFPMGQQYQVIIDSGKASFNATAAAACISAQQTAGCWQAALPGTTCTGVFTGSVTVGGTCMSSAECVSGSYCTQNSAPGYCVSGTCQPFALPGQACNPGRCAPGLGCSSGVCATVQYVGLGQACDNVATICKQGYRCDAGLCVAPLAAGDSCSAGVCDYGLGCAPNNTCQSYVGLGGSCDASHPCGDAMTCTGGTCALDYAQLGASCASLRCLPGNVCDPATTTCVPVLGAGAPCTFNTACWSGSCTAGSCTSPICSP